MTALRWTRTRRVGDPGELHRYRPEIRELNQLSILDPTLTGIVLGSAQRKDYERVRSIARPKGYEVVVRDSGGGAVLVGPGLQFWFAIYEQTNEGVLSQSIPESFHGIGQLALRVVRELGVPNAQIVSEPSSPDALSRAICFSGVSWGEVEVGGAKLVGISQRRSRGMRLFHVMISIESRQRELLEYFELPEDVRATFRPQVSLSDLGVPIPQVDNFGDLVFNLVQDL